MSITDDNHCTETIISHSSRRSPLTMGLLWVTMVTVFPCVLVGFSWFKSGLSLVQVIACTIIGSLMLLAYSLPAAHIGSVSGRSYCSLIKSVFGKFGNSIVSFNLIWMFIAWYGLAALFLAEGLEGLFQWKLPLAVLAPAFAVAMAFNNFWGFKGVANFARFFAAPMLIVWVFYTLTKVTVATSPAVFSEPSSCSFPLALSMVANFVIGICVWGNEADYWRHGKAKVSHSGVPMSTALLIGVIIFPITGWLVARMTGITENGAATAFMNDYSFGGVALIGAIVLTASYFAANDSNLFGSSSALSSLAKLPHRTSVVWGGQRALFIFEHQSGQIGLYYDIQTVEPIAAESGGGAFETCTIVMKNRIFIPVPPAIQVGFLPKAGERKRVEVKYDILYMERR